MTDKPEVPLTQAASAFEAELERYAQIAAEIERAPLTSEKGLNRAKKALRESADCQERLGAALHALLAAMETSRNKQHRCMEQTLDAARRVQARAEEYGRLMERFAGLGQRAKDVNEPVSAVVVRQEAGAPPEEILAGLREILVRTEAVIVEAEGLSKDASEAGWAEIAREADSLKQQVASARNRVLIAERSVAGRAPS